MFSSDKPIENLADDQLGRKDLALMLATGIKNFKSDDNASFVVGIQGKWGDGKTSFINMMLQKGQEPSQRIFTQDEFLIVEFNPWYFTGEDQILKQFCGLLSEEIGSSPNITEGVKNAAKMIKRISAIVKPIQPVLDISGTFLGLQLAGTMASGIIDKASEFATSLEEAFQPTEDVTALKEKIAKNLKEFSRKILVVIDDIDRLSHAEIYEIFRLVKVIADFPNTIYLLSYDKQKVKFALKDRGHDINFIEKIVQHEFDLPEMDEQMFASIYDRGLYKIFEKHGPQISQHDREYHRKLVFYGLKNSLKNIRDVKRILNKLEFEYGCLLGEVNFFDLLALTILRVYYPSAVDFLKNEGRHFFNVQNISKEDMSKIYSEFKSSVPRSDRWVTDVLEVIFPALTGQDPSSINVIGQHISSKEHFNKYFQLAVPSSVIPDARYAQFVQSQDEYRRLYAFLRLLQAEGQEKQVIEGIEKRLALFDQEHLSNLITALLNFSDISDDTNREFFSLSVSGHSFWTAVRALKMVEKSKRSKIFFEVIEKCREGKCALVRFVDVIGREHGYFSPIGQQELLMDAEKYVSTEDLDRGRSVCIDLMDHLEMLPAMDYDQVMSSSNLAQMIFALERWKYPNLAVFRARLLGVQDGFLRMVRHFTTLVISSDAGAYLKTQFEDIRAFMGEEIPNDRIISQIETHIRQSVNQQLIKEVTEGLGNARDPRR